jgi:hypothetical protein
MPHNMVRENVMKGGLPGGTINPTPRKEEELMHQALRRGTHLTSLM